MPGANTLTWTDAADRDRDALLCQEDAWALYAEAETEAGRCPYCTLGRRMDAFGNITACTSCDGSGVALHN